MSSIKELDLHTFSYGSDQSGLIWGFAFTENGLARNINSGEAMQWLSGSRSPDSREFIWLHCNLSNTASEKWIRKLGVVTDEFYETLYEGSKSTRIELAEGTLIAVVNDVLHDFTFDVSDISTLWISVSRNVVVSARCRPLQSIERLRQAVHRGEAIRSSMELLNHLLQGQAEVLGKIVRQAAVRVDDIEDGLLAERLNPRRAQLGSLRRVLVRLQRLLAPEPAALFRLLQRPPAWISDMDLQELRQSTEEFSVVLSDMTSLQERIKLLQEEIAARVNEENGRSLYLLTIVTVLALPINICAGLMGMNVSGIPLADQQYGFWIIVSIVASFTAVAALLVFLKQKE